jgi:hypothetical protein
MAIQSFNSGMTKEEYTKMKEKKKRRKKKL